MSSPVTNSSSASSAATASTSSAAPGQSADKNMFLKLLVAQLRNQNPMNPSDGTQFVAQLAQFQQLEQAINTGQDIAAIRSDLNDLIASGSSNTNASQA